MTQSTALGNTPGFGRILYSLDQQGSIPPNNAVMTSETNFVFTNVTPGTHTFRAELVNNDKTSLVPAEYALVTIVLP